VRTVNRYLSPCITESGFAMGSPRIFDILCTLEMVCASKKKRVLLDA
jgi:hypothetical protein